MNGVAWLKMTLYYYHSQENENKVGSNEERFTLLHRELISVLPIWFLDKIKLLSFSFIFLYVKNLVVVN
jgi:hypothetical protein